MRGYYLRKTAGAFCVLFVIVSLNFFLPRMIFADPAQPYFVGVPEDAVALREQIRQAHGFHEPLPVQYLRYLKRVVMLDLGQSHYYKDSVWSVMFSRIPWSLVLTVSSMVLSVFFGILFGTAAGRRRNGRADRVLMGLSGISTAIPSFWLAMVGMMLFGFVWKILPYRGAMTAGYTLTMDGSSFWWGFGAGLLASVTARVLARHGTASAGGLQHRGLSALPGDLACVRRHHCFVQFSDGSGLSPFRPSN